MTSKKWCVAALCLLLAGCGVMEGATRRPLGRLRLPRARLQSRSTKESFTEAVENDPFPKAGQTGPRV